VDQSTKTTVKVAAMAEFFARQQTTSSERRLVFGRRPRRVITTKLLREWAAERADCRCGCLGMLPDCPGDLAETISYSYHRPMEMKIDP
jgi:DNA ligase-1